MESYNSNNDKPKISLNRKKRMWNRYRNYIAGLAVLVVAVIIVAIVLKSCSNKNSDRQDDTKVTTSPVQQERKIPDGLCRVLGNVLQRLIVNKHMCLCGVKS